MFVRLLKLLSVHLGEDFATMKGGLEQNHIPVGDMISAHDMGQSLTQIMEKLPDFLKNMRMQEVRYKKKAKNGGEMTPIIRKSA